MLRPPSTRSRMIRFSVAGIPVEVDLTFFLVPLLFTFGTGMPAGFIVLLGAIVFVSVLWHELGHAVAFRRFGLNPKITVYGLGGLASADGELTPGRDIIVSLAGPAAGFLLGGLAFVTLGRGEFTYQDPVAFATWLAVYANLFWTAVNLLPALPLDGGRVMAAAFRAVLGPQGRKPALLISAVVSAAGAAWAFGNQYIFAAILATYFVIGNITEFQSERMASGGSKAGPLARGFQALEAGDFRKAAIIGRKRFVGVRDPKSAAGAGVLLLWAYALGGKFDQAAALIDQYMSGIMPNPLLDEHAVVAAGGRQGAVRALKSVHEISSSSATAAYYARGLVEAGNIDDALALLGSRPEPGDAALATVIISGLVKNGRYSAAAEVAERYFDATGDPQAAFAVAGIWARADEKAWALSWLRRAVDAGFADVDRLDADGTFEGLRADRDYLALRQRVRPR